MDKPTVALYDFDGTITTCDTMSLFVDFVCGKGAFRRALLHQLPALCRCVAGRLAGKEVDFSPVKEAVLQPCFKGSACGDMQAVAHAFVAVIEGCLNRRVMQSLRAHQEAGHRVAIVSASPAVWIEPWARLNGIDSVIATRMAVADMGGACTYTGRFEGVNCNGEEKRRRVEAAFPRGQFHLVAYGNSRGDYPLLRYAHEAYLCSRRDIRPFVVEPEQVPL